MRPHPWQWSVSVSTGNTSALVRGQFTDKSNGKTKLKEIFQIVLLGIWCKTSRNRMNIETCLQNNCMYRMCSIFPCKFQTTTCLCAFGNCEGSASFFMFNIKNCTATSIGSRGHQTAKIQQMRKRSQRCSTTIFMVGRSGACYFFTNAFVVFCRCSPCPCNETLHIGFFLRTWTTPLVIVREGTHKLIYWKMPGWLSGWMYERNDAKLRIQKKRRLTPNSPPIWEPVRGMHHLPVFLPSFHITLLWKQSTGLKSNHIFNTAPHGSDTNLVNDQQMRPL